MKNARHLQATAPHILPKKEPAEGFRSRIPDQILAGLHTPLPPAELNRVGGLAAALQKHPAPKPRAAASAPLFNGTLVFAQVAFRTSKGFVSVKPADLATAMDFTRLAVVPISAYATQYGPNRLDLAPQAVPFNADAGSGSYNDQTLQSWVNAIVAQHHLPADTCVVILNPPGVVNTDADPSQGVGGYHGIAQVPYAFVNVMGSGLTVKDEANLYALALSHEIAEMTVDPRADLGNPEIADPCGPNCQTVWIDYFNNAGGYIQTSQAFPPPFDYAFFINAIVQPQAATQCPAPGATCAYAPP
jgi:hypothetical protein